MLAALQVRDFGLIDRLELVFGPGLNVITGETGAGKSMLIDAMLLVCGGRANSEQIRTGTGQATVDALFDVNSVPGVADKLAGFGIAQGADELVISRELNASGRHLCRVNGRPVSAATARELAMLLVDIHGQHEHQALMHPAWHREVLDAFGGSDHLDLVQSVQELFRDLQELQANLAEVAGDSRDRAHREDLLRFQLAEIEAAAPRPGEDEELRAERHLLVNAERLAAAVDAAYQALFDAAARTGAPRRGAGPGGGEGSGRDVLAGALTGIEGAAPLDPRLDGMVETLRTMVYTLDDLGRDLQGYRDRLESDPQRLEQVQARLETLSNLRRKYADAIEGVLEFAADARRQLEQLASSEALAEQLEAEIGATRAELAAVAAELSRSRVGLAERLAAAVRAELVVLGMPAAEFHAPVRQTPSPSDGLEVAGARLAVGAHGLDEVEFMLSPNPGEPPRRLIRAASGGELSRVMLALKTVLARADNIPAMIFDEIDSGIGGRTANAVGLRLAQLAGTHQVLCVTHLPQIAAFGDHHYVVVKESGAAATRTGVREVTGEARLAELARMLGGEAGAQPALEHARELITQSSRAKDTSPAPSPAV